MLATVIGWIVGFSDFVEHHIGAITAVIAGAAVFQWRETRLTAERQLRAYVQNFSTSLYEASNLEFATFVDRTGQVAVAVVIKNMGQTPAYKVLHWSSVQVLPVSQEWSLAVPKKLQEFSAAILGPDHTMSASRWLERAISPQEAEGIQKGTYAVYSHGRIEYVDAFKTKRWCNYRMRYTNAAWPPIGKGGATMNFCDQGNDAN